VWKKSKNFFFISNLCIYVYVQNELALGDGGAAEEEEESKSKNGKREVFPATWRVFASDFIDEKKVPKGVSGSSPNSESKSPYSFFNNMA